MIDWSVSFNGLTLGPGTSYGVAKVAGWLDMPSMRTSDMPRSQAQGAFPTSAFSDARIVEVDFDIASDNGPFADAVAALLKATPLNGALTSLTIQIPGRSAETVQAQVRRRSVPTEQEYAFGLTSAALQFYAPDPLRYGAQVFSQIGLSGVTGTGLVFPLAFPLDFGVPAGTTPGSVQVANNGTEPYWPTLKTQGPVPNPVITLNETGSWVRYNGTLASGQYLQWDLANRRVLLNGKTSVRKNVTSSGDWLAVPVGGGSISWSADSSDPNAYLDVWSYEGATS